MESARFPSRGGFSVRGIFALVLAVFITVLLSFTLLSSTAHAAGPAEWSGDTILFENHGFNEDNQFSDPTNTIPSGATVYKTPVQPGTGSGSSKVFIIYFSSGVDPPTATSAEYVEFDITSSGTISNPQNAQSITITTQAQSQNSGSSCAISGVGWMVCSLSTFLADGMDTIFDIMANMIKVQPPVLGDTNNSMYVAWNIMRAIANIAFVIVFLIIIYSQLTNFGVNNYGLKRLIPRLIVAAILVNLSFYISALAIDLSNIAGYSIQDIFVGIREDVFQMTDDTVNNNDALTNPSWAALTAVILAGGGVIGGVYFAATGGIYLLLPLLLGLILTIVFVVIVLAARQAIILVLVIVAPLAFVANLLPNTEKWFGKWKDLFMTMLIFFPAFSLVFGGSQLAGQIIIQNAGDDIIMLLFGMAVQIAPLVITPLLLKLSGSLLGKIAQIANNPRKGLLDRNRNWAQARAEHAKQKNLDEGPRLRNPASWGAGMVRRTAYRKQRLQDRTDAHKIGAENNYHKTPGYEKISQMKAERETEKEGIHAHHEEHLNQLKRTSGTRLHDSTNATLAAKKRADISDKKTQRYQNTAMRNERFANRIGANALYQANYGLEAEKANLERSENLLNEHYTVERTTSGTVLEKAAVRLEGSKLRVEGATNKYNEHISTVKRTVKGGELSRATIMAESSKELADAANNELQAYLDTQRKSKRTELGKSTIALEKSKSVAEDAKADLTTFITNERTRKGGSLRQVTMRAEEAKQEQQIAESNLAKLIDEFKSGKIDATELTKTEQTLMKEMQANATRLAATKRGADSAQYEVQRNFAELLTSNDPADAALKEEMLTIAQSVGGSTARDRAISNAVATARGLDSDALKANVDLLKDEARRKNKNIKYYSRDIVETVLSGASVMPDGTVLTPERIKAALQAQAEEKNIPMFERMAGSKNFLPYTDMLKEVIALNSAPFKGAGAFAMQDKLLTLADFDTPEDFQHQLSLDHLGNLASANSTGIAGWKMGEVVELANSIGTDIKASLEEIARGKKPDATDDDKRAAAEAAENLKASFRTVHEALQNDDVRAGLKDRESYVRKIDRELAALYGVEPVPEEPLELKYDDLTYTPPAPGTDSTDIDDDSDSDDAAGPTT